MRDGFCVGAGTTHPSFAMAAEVQEVLISTEIIYQAIRQK